MAVIKKKCLSWCFWSRAIILPNSKGTIHIVFYIEWLPLKLSNAVAIF